MKLLFIKTDCKNLLKKYKPLSLAPICDKIFEKCINHTKYFCFENNNLFTLYLSGFRKQCFCISQLLDITNEIFSNFNVSSSFEISVFFIISLRYLIVFGMKVYCLNHMIYKILIICS